MLYIWSGGRVVAIEQPDVMYHETKPLGFIDISKYLSLIGFYGLRACGKTEMTLNAITEERISMTDFDIVRERFPEHHAQVYPADKGGGVYLYTGSRGDRTYSCIGFDRQGSLDAAYADAVKRIKADDAAKAEEERKNRVAAIDATFKKLADDVVTGGWSRAEDEITLNGKKYVASVRTA